MEVGGAVVVDGLGRGRRLGRLDGGLHHLAHLRVVRVRRADVVGREGQRRDRALLDPLHEVDPRRQLRHRDVGRDVLLGDLGQLRVLAEHVHRVDLVEHGTDEAPLPAHPREVVGQQPGTRIPEGVVPVEGLAAGLDVALDAGDPAAAGVVPLDRQPLGDVDRHAAHGVDQLLEPGQVDHRGVVHVQPGDLADDVADGREAGVGVVLEEGLVLLGDRPDGVDEALVAGSGAGAVVAVGVELVQRVAARERRPLQAARDADEDRVAGLRVDAHLDHGVGTRALTVVAGVRTEQQQVDAVDVRPRVRRLGLGGRGLQGRRGEAADGRPGEDRADDVALDERVADHLDRRDRHQQADEGGEEAQAPRVAAVDAVGRRAAVGEDDREDPDQTADDRQAGDGEQGVGSHGDVQSGRDGALGQHEERHDDHHRGQQAEHDPPQPAVPRAEETGARNQRQGRVDQRPAGLATHVPAATRPRPDRADVSLLRHAHLPAGNSSYGGRAYLSELGPQVMYVSAR